MDGSTLARRLLDRRHRARTSSMRRAPFRDAAALVFDRDADRQVVFETMDWEHPGRQALLGAQPVAHRAVGAARGRARRGSDSGDVQRRRRRRCARCPTALRAEARRLRRVADRVRAARLLARSTSPRPTATKGRALAWRARAARARARRGDGRRRQLQRSSRCWSSPARRW